MSGRAAVRHMSSERVRGRSDQRRGGFALPLVILLTLVVSLAVAVLMQRNGTGYLAARRQADSYIKAHAGLGIREMVSRWLTQVRGRLSDSLESDGFAFTLVLPGGDHIDVYLDDAQGSALARSDALTGRRREIIEMMNAYLDLLEYGPIGAAPGQRPPPRAQTGGAGDLPLRRMYGPSEISLKTAPREVLEALAAAVADPKQTVAIADTIIRKREGHDGTRVQEVDEITRSLREVGVDDEAIREIGLMLVATPKLYKVTAELRGSGDRLLDKAEGLLEVNEGNNDPFNMNGPFLTWESVELEDHSPERGG